MTVAVAATTLPAKRSLSPRRVGLGLTRRSNFKLTHYQRVGHSSRPVLRALAAPASPPGARICARSRWRRVGPTCQYAMRVSMSAKESKDLAGHLLYEINTLAELPQWIDKFAREGPPILKIACVEAALVHARTLIEFAGGRQRAVDITPDLFVRAWSPDTALKEKYLALIDQHLAHLSRARTTAVTAIEWSFTEMVDDIMRALQPFADMLENEGSPHASSVKKAIQRDDHNRAKHPIIASTTDANVVVVSPAWSRS